MTSKLQKNLQFILEFLTSKGQTISVAESCTGGYLSYLLTTFPGSSVVFKQGLVTYSNISKSNHLQIELELIERLGAVSTEIAVLMAQQIRELSHTSFGIGLTGNAGPSIVEKSKQVGEVYVSLSSKHNTVCYLLKIDGDRDQIRKKSAEQAVHLLADFFRKEPS